MLLSLLSSLLLLLLQHGVGGDEGGGDGGDRGDAKRGVKRQKVAAAIVVDNRTAFKQTRAAEWGRTA